MKGSERGTEAGSREDRRKRGGLWRETGICSAEMRPDTAVPTAGEREE